MAGRIISGRKLGKELVAQGLVPATASDVDIKIELNGTIRMSTSWYLTDDDLAKLAQAIADSLDPTR
jgi:hypothetical protein